MFRDRQFTGTRELHDFGIRLCFLEHNLKPGVGKILPVLRESHAIVIREPAAPVPSPLRFGKSQKMRARYSFIFIAEMIGGIEYWEDRERYPIERGWL